MSDSLGVKRLRRAWGSVVWTVLAASLLLAACAPASTGGTSASKPGASGGAGSQGTQQAQTSPVPKVMRGGIIRTFGVACPDLDLSKTWCSPHSDAEYGVYRGLVKWRSDSYYDEAILPDLAESWETSKDAKTITLHIRKGMRFPNVAPVNGREFTANDVAFNIDMVKKDKRLLYSLYQWIESYQIPDPYTIVIKLSQSYGPFLTAMGTAEAGLMWTKEIYERDGGFSKDAIGVGPFYLKSWESNVEFRSQRNPNYWEMSEIDGQRLPYVDGFSLLYLRDDASRLAAFRAKRMDQWYVVGFPIKEDVESLRQTNPDAVIVEEVFGGGHLGFNYDRPPFNNLKARQAVMYAIDKDELMEQAWSGGKRGEYFHPRSPLAWDEKTIKEKLAFDQNKAKQLWQEAGYKDTKPLKLVARTEGSQGSGDIKSGQVLVQMLNEAGIKTELMVYQDMAQSAAVDKAGEWDLGTFGTCSSAVERNSTGTYGAHFTGCRSDSVGNYHGVKDKKIDQMQSDALFEPDQDKAVQKWKALRDYLHENMYGFNYGVPLRWNIDQAWIHYAVKVRQHSGARSEGTERAWLDERYTGTR